MDETNVNNEIPMQSKFYDQENNFQSAPFFSIVVSQ